MRHDLEGYFNSFYFTIKIKISNKKYVQSKQSKIFNSYHTIDKSQSRFHYLLPKTIFYVIKQMQMFNIIETLCPQQHLFSTIQVQDYVKPKRHSFNTLSHPIRTKDKQPERSIVICPQHKKSLQKVLILPLMDIKHYKEILGQNQHNHKDERLQFTAQYMQKMPPTHQKKYFAQSFLINKKPQIVDSNKMEQKIPRSVDLKKQQSIPYHTNNMVIKTPQVSELQNHKKTNRFFHGVKRAKDFCTSPNEVSLQKGKASSIQRMLSRYQKLQEQSDGSEYQVMSKWLIGRRLTNHKERS